MILLVASSGPLPVGAETVPPPTAPLAAPSSYETLAVDGGFGRAVVSLPLGSTGKRPVVIAAHGNYDRPEWQCEVWRGIVRNRGFVLCPRGVPRPDSPSRTDIRFTYRNQPLLWRE